jgi:hypothetical protein
MEACMGGLFALDEVELGVNEFIRVVREPS